MAGDWIKMRSNLWDDPRITSICDKTSSSEAVIVGALYWLWAAADQHSEDGVMPGLTLRAIDRKTGVQGFGDALVSVGWVSDHPDGARLARFDEHNGESAKRRCVDAKRKANVRKVTDNTRTDDGQIPDVLRETSELEKEKEKEKEKEGKSKAKAAPKARKPTKTALPEDFFLSDAVIAWAARSGHQNLQAHFDSFVRKAKASGYMYVDWDQALQNAVADDWAKLRTPQARGSPPGGYQTANDKAKSLADRLTGKTRNEPTFDFIDLNAFPS